MENSIALTIPELNYVNHFNIRKNGEEIRLRIHGICLPINPEVGASIEEYVKQKDIVIK